MTGSRLSKADARTAAVIAYDLDAAGFRLDERLVIAQTFAAYLPISKRAAFIDACKRESERQPEPITAKCGRTDEHGAHSYLETSGPRNGHRAWCAGNRDTVPAER